MRIVDLVAHPVSVPAPPGHGSRLALGRVVKTDAVLVKVTTESGIVGWGESHPARAPGTVAHLVNTTLRALVLGRAADDVTGAWDRVYRAHVATHGLGAASVIALSGIDMALWDVRAKAAGWPLYRLLGGAARGVPAYAGGFALGHQPPASLAERARDAAALGYRAVKIRLGDGVERDLARVAAVREALGDAIAVFTDANAAYTLDDARRVLPALDAHGVGWLEEPFAPHDEPSYAAASRFGRTPLAAGENHYTRFEFRRLVEAGAVRVLQPDLSKCGGITEALRIAALASAWRLPVSPHTSFTGLNMAATVHFLCAVDNAGWFEADHDAHAPLRDELCSASFGVDAEGRVNPLEAPGIGVEIDEGFIAAHPLIDGPSYV